MEKRLIVAIILSIVVLVTFQRFIKPPTSEDEPEILEENIQQEYLPEQTEVTRPTELPVTLQEEVSEFALETEKLYLKLSNLGAQINQISLKDPRYKKDDGSLLSILDIEFPEQPGIGRVIFSKNRLENPVIWQVNESEDSITFSLKIKENLRIIKKFTAISDYSILLSIYAENDSNSAQELEYSVFGTSNISREDKLDSRYANITVSYNNIDKLNKISLNKIKQSLTEEPGSFEWIAQQNTYFSFIFIPEKAIVSSVFYKDKDNFIASGARALPSVIRGNSTSEDIYSLYMGPNDIQMLESFNPGCQRLVNFGMFNPISTFLLKLLRLINKLVHNYGVSIIFLTIIVNIFLFPLTRKSFTSMKKMQELQPHINKLRDEHKENPHKMNKEMMGLYKKHGGNPLGGCLPMFLQFPIFISLYLALTKSIELKGASFLWISDLASPDAAFKIPHLLPFIGNKINVLPILMLIAMFMQQRISQKKNTAQMASQKQMMLIMPIMFGFIFYHFPSGLVLYWLTNTVIMGFTQWRMLSASSEPNIETEDAEN